MPQDLMAGLGVVTYKYDAVSEAEFVRHDSGLVSGPVWTPRNPYLKMDSASLAKLDLRVSWKDLSGEQQPVELSPDKFWTCSHVGMAGDPEFHAQTRAVHIKRYEEKAEEAAQCCAAARKANKV